jgi:hypothetical protein
MCISSHSIDSYGVTYLVFDVAPSLRDPCQGAASACSRGRLEATAAVLTGAASVSSYHREAAPDVVGATRRTPP